MSFSEDEIIQNPCFDSNGSEGDPTLESSRSHSIGSSISSSSTEEIIEVEVEEKAQQGGVGEILPQVIPTSSSSSRELSTSEEAAPQAMSSSQFFLQAFACLILSVPTALLAFLNMLHIDLKDAKNIDTGINESSDSQFSWAIVALSSTLFVNYFVNWEFVIKLQDFLVNLMMKIINLPLLILLTPLFFLLNLCGFDLKTEDYSLFSLFNIQESELSAIEWVSVIWSIPSAINMFQVALPAFAFLGPELALTAGCINFLSYLGARNFGMLRVLKMLGYNKDESPQRFLNEIISKKDKNLEERYTHQIPTDQETGSEITEENIKDGLVDFLEYIHKDQNKTPAERQFETSRSGWALTRGSTLLGLSCGFASWPIVSQKILEGLTTITGNEVFSKNNYQDPLMLALAYVLAIPTPAVYFTTALKMPPWFFHVVNTLYKNINTKTGLWLAVFLIPALFTTGISGAGAEETAVSERESNELDYLNLLGGLLDVFNFAGASAINTYCLLCVAFISRFGDFKSVPVQDESIITTDQSDVLNVGFLSSEPKTVNLDQLKELLWDLNTNPKVFLEKINDMFGLELGDAFIESLKKSLSELSKKEDKNTFKFFVHELPEKVSQWCSSFSSTPSENTED